MFYILILIALGTVWLDILAGGWWPIWLYPIWLWLGIYITVQDKNRRARWYWILSVMAWTMFVAAPLYAVAQASFYALAGEVYNYVYHRYLPVKSIILPALVGAVFLLAAHTLTLFLTHQAVTWHAPARVATTVIITMFIGAYYGTFSAGKKRKYF